MTILRELLNIVAATLSSAFGRHRELDEWIKRHPPLPAVETYDPEAVVARSPQTRTPQKPPQPTAEGSFQLPDLKDESLRSIRVKSSDGERYYTVNLLDYTCTCPSF